MAKLVIIGGNSLHTSRYIRGLLEFTNFEISIISNSQIGEFAGVLTQHIINFSLTNWRASRQISRILEEYAADYLHIHQANSYAWHSLRAVARLHKRPRVILSTWGSDVLLVPQKNWLLAQMVKYNLKNADVITTNCLYMANIISKLLNGKPRAIHTIHFGLESIPLKQDLRAKKKIILSSRAHSPLYRIDKIICCFAYLRQKQLIDDDYRLIIAASGPQTTYLQQLAEQLNINQHCLFTGMLNYQQLSHYYQQASLYVSVPYSDATASSVLEAMAFGCIPILSNLPASYEAVLDKINGFICPDVDHLAAQVLSAVQLSLNKADYQAVYDFNYTLVAKKATFVDNMQQFIGLYCETSAEA